MCGVGGCVCMCVRCACQYLNVLTNKGNFPTHKLTPNPNYIPIQNKGN